MHLVLTLAFLCSAILALSSVWVSLCLLVELIVVHELSKVILLLYSDCFSKLSHLLVEELICNVLHISMEVGDRVLGEIVGWQNRVLVA